MPTSQRDAILHAVLIVIILIMGVVIYYFLSLYYSSADYFRNSFLMSLQIFNPEFAVQETSPPETPLPESLHVPILIYHSIRPHLFVETPLLARYTVAPDSFEKQLKYLKDNGYTVVGLDYLADAFSQKILLPPKPVVITLDDGWANQYNYAFPLLEKYRDTATFFIFTNAVGHSGFFTWDQVRAIDNAGMTIGGHTESHPYLLQVEDEATLENEIIGGKKVIETHLGRPITLFAYPFGSYNDQIVSIVKAAGYKAVRSSRRGVYNSKDDLYALKAVEITDDMNAFKRAVNF